MKPSNRYRRPNPGHGLVVEWPQDAPSPDQIAERVRYLGSAEHKEHPVHPSFDLVPMLRSTNSACPPEIGRDEAEAALRRGVRTRCVSAAFDGGFPRYVWARIEGRPFCARLTNWVQGHYKGWPVAEAELPADAERRLDQQAWTGDVS